ncbi:MAG: serine/threonine protein kinase, partial [Persicimonas sp.]
MIKVCPTCEQTYPEDTEFCAQDGTPLEVLQDDDADELVGRTLDGRWVIEERIGEGGMGAVYLASQRSVDRKVAIKTLRPELCNSREFVDRFFREARVASNIAHPHCVTILDFGQADDGTLYLAMEYLEGVPLTHRLDHPDLTTREIIRICAQISSALTAAHEQNIIHRDLKPDNVFLLSISDGSTFVKVLDFGIAKVLDAEEQMTKTGQVFGTPEYMSPEQCRGNQLDGRADLYSLGCILYQMLGDQPPFSNDTPMAVLVSHVNDSPRPIEENLAREDTPRQLCELCMELLEKDPDDRPDNARQVRDRLEAILDESRSTGNQTPAVTPAASEEGDEASGDAQSTGTAPTLAPSTGEIAADGGGERSTPGQTASVDDGATPTPAERFGPTNTVADQAVDDSKGVSAGFIIGVGLIALIAAGCTVGAAYAAYTQFFQEDDASSVFAFLDEEGSEDGDSEEDPAADSNDDGSDDERDPGGDEDDGSEDDKEKSEDGAKKDESKSGSSGAAARPDSDGRADETDDDEESG